MKTKLFLVLLLVNLVHTAFSQKFMTDEDCVGLIKKSVNRLAGPFLGLSTKLLKTEDFEVIERNPDATPKLVKFDYTAKWAYSEPNEFKTGTVIVYFAQGYPISFYEVKNINRSFDYLFETSALEYPDKEKKIINKLYSQFRLAVAMENESFQRAWASMKSYPASTNPVNCLGIISKNETLYTFKFSYNKAMLVDVNGKIVGRGDPLDDKIDVTPVGTNVVLKYFKNICDHDVVIRGIMKRTYPNDDVEYFDTSILLKPNQTTDYFKFTRGGWNDASKYNVQYFIDE